MSPELNSIYQAGFLGFLSGALYGGFIHSRNAYEGFMEKNQATAFKSHLDAKKKLQDQVTINFAKGAFRLVQIYSKISNNCLLNSSDLVGDYQLSVYSTWE